MKTLLLTGLLLAICSSLSFGQFSANGLETDNHEEISLVIEELNKKASDIGLTKNRIESRVKIRLRQVRLKTVDKKSEFLYVVISVFESAFSISVNYRRPVKFPAEGNTYVTYADVYSEGLIGTYSRDPEFIIQSLDGLLDYFISDYLDAND